MAISRSDSGSRSSQTGGWKMVQKCLLNVHAWPAVSGAGLGLAQLATFAAFTAFVCLPLSFLALYRTNHFWLAILTAFWVNNMAHAADTNLSGTLCNGRAIVQMLRAKNYLMDLRNLSSWNRNLNRNRSLWGGDWKSREVLFWECVCAGVAGKNSFIDKTCQAASIWHLVGQLLMPLVAGLRVICGSGSSCWAAVCSHWNAIQIQANDCSFMNVQRWPRCAIVNLRT